MRCGRLRALRAVPGFACRPLFTDGTQTPVRHGSRACVGAWARLAALGSGPAVLARVRRNNSRIRKLSDSRIFAQALRTRGFPTVGKNPFERLMDARRGTTCRTGQALQSGLGRAMRALLCRQDRCAGASRTGPSSSRTTIPHFDPSPASADPDALRRRAACHARTDMPATMAWPIRAARALLCALACLLPLAAPAAPPTLAQCHGIKDLAFVAHLDDDLLFMNPGYRLERRGGRLRAAGLPDRQRRRRGRRLHAGPRARRARGLCLHGASAR